MNKVTLILLSVALIGASAAPADVQEPEQISTFIKDSEDMITSVYRKAIAQAVDTKVNELKTAINTGDNVVPAAIDILKLTLLSNPTQQTIRKTAEHIINLMSPEIRKLMLNKGTSEETTAQPMKVEEKPAQPMPKETNIMNPNSLQ